MAAPVGGQRRVGGANLAVFDVHQGHRGQAVHQRRPVCLGNAVGDAALVELRVAECGYRGVTLPSRGPTTYERRQTRWPRCEKRSLCAQAIHTRYCVPSSSVGWPASRSRSKSVRSRPFGPLGSLGRVGGSCKGSPMSICHQPAPTDTQAHWRWVSAGQLAGPARAAPYQALAVKSRDGDQRQRLDHLRALVQQNDRERDVVQHRERGRRARHACAGTSFRRACTCLVSPAAANHHRGDRRTAHRRRPPFGSPTRIRACAPGPATCARACAAHLRDGPQRSRLARRRGRKNGSHPVVPLVLLGQVAGLEHLLQLLDICERSTLAHVPGDDASATGKPVRGRQAGRRAPSLRRPLAT